MESFKRYHRTYHPKDKVGLAFCAGANQSIGQFIHVGLMNGVYTWATVDDTSDTRPTVVGNARNHRLLRSLPQRYFDVVFFANCPYMVYGEESFDQQWFGMIKRLVKPGGEIIFRGLPGLEGWWRDPDYEENYVKYHNLQEVDVERSVRKEATPYLDDALQWFHENVDPSARIEVMPEILPWDYRPDPRRAVFLVVPVM